MDQIEGSLALSHRLEADNVLATSAKEIRFLLDLDLPPLAQDLFI
jgi:hypothetical protein